MLALLPLLLIGDAGVLRLLPCLGVFVLFHSS
jgi:hypothetical protein